MRDHLLRQGIRQLDLGFHPLDLRNQPFLDGLPDRRQLHHQPLLVAAALTVDVVVQWRTVAPQESRYLLPGDLLPGLRELDQLVDRLGGNQRL